MVKKLFLVTLCLSVFSICAIAEQVTPGAPASSGVQPATPKKRVQQNKPTVGGRQAGSEQLFGQGATPPATAQKEQKSHRQNNPIVGGRQAGSEQLFGQGATPPATKQPYTNPHITKGNANSPAVGGGRQAGSEQLFGQSATPHN